jgi:hypothetical protein
MDTILEEKQYILIYKISYLSLLSSLYAAYNTHYNLALCNGSIFLTSIHYWKKPDYSYRRYLDMIIVKSSVIYQYYIAYNAQYSIIYYIIFTIGLLAYSCGIFYYYKKDYWKSTYAHIILHLMGNIASIILYSGNIKSVL